MRCLIPITQEIRNENAMKRAHTLCDDIHILYVVDESLFERMERESAYVLNSDMLDVLKKTLIESQKEEAESIAVGLGKKARLHFEVGDNFDIIEKYALKLRPDLIMVDDMDRKLLSLKTAVWVDRGNEIKNGVFVVSSIAHINRFRRNVEFLDTICERMKCHIQIYPDSLSEHDRELLKSFEEISEQRYADIVFYQNSDKRAEKRGSFMFFR